MATSVARNVFPGAVVGRSFVLSVLFLVLVIALFFIPEIIHLQESLFKTSSKRAKSVSISSYKVDEESAKTSAAQKSHELSALDKILVMVNSGYIEGTKAAPPDGQASSRARLSISSLLPKQEQAQEAPINPDEGLSWRTLRNPGVMKVLRKARDDVRKLAKDIGPHRIQSRDALLSYQNGISWLLEGDRSPVPIQSALDYVERLDLDVTRALLKEKVDRSDYLRWSAVSLGPVFANSKATRIKQEYLAPYNPRITLAKVKVTIGKARVEKDGSIMAPSSRLKVVGFILGKDTKQVQLFKDGRRIKGITAAGKVDGEGKRVFRFTAPSAEGRFTIQASDSMDYVVQKNYRFLPRAAHFVRNFGAKSITLPFGSIEDTRSFEIREVDLRLDRFFRESINAYGPNQSMAEGEKYQLVAF